MKIRKLFRGTFEQSTKIMPSRVVLLTGNDEAQISSNSLISNIIVLVGSFLSFMVQYALGQVGEHLKDTHEYNNEYVFQLSVFLHPLFITILIIEGIITLIWIFGPRINLAFRRWSGCFIFISWFLATLVISIPWVIGVTLKYTSFVLIIIELLLVVSFEYWRVKIWINRAMNKMYNINFQKSSLDKFISKIFNFDRPFKYQVKMWLIIAMSLVIIGIINQLIMGKEINLLLIGACLGPIVIYIALSEIFFKTLKYQLYWYYLMKYPTEYRLYFKIPDRIWYLGEKRAAKHPHVYAPEDKGKTE